MHPFGLCSGFLVPPLLTFLYEPEAASPLLIPDGRIAPPPADWQQQLSPENLPMQPEA